MKKLVLIIFSLIIIATVLTFNSIINKNKVNTEENNFLYANNEDTNKQKLKILVVEVNPYLKTKNNIKASEYLGFNGYEKLAVDEIIEDLEYGSRGYIDGEIIDWIDINEFHTYTKQIKLDNGKMSNRLDEETWLNIMKDGMWYGHWDKDKVKEIGGFIYDYEYIMNKLKLIERRNNNEFDQVWIVNIDPMVSYESMMVGRTAYWVNGTPIIKDCKNFVIMNVSISRRDANLECTGHMTEQILDAVFKPSYNSYQKNAIKVTDIDNLNPWERFTLNEYTSPGYSSVGNIHFAPNSERDYDWTNEKKVNSSWEDWLNYPNLNGKTQLTNYKAWVPEGKENESCRYHHRWWFYLMPNINGVDKNGYLNNWWKYIYSLDYVKNIYCENEELQEISIGDEITDLKFKLEYQSNNIEYLLISKKTNNIKITDTSIIDFVDGKLEAKKFGTTDISMSVDGKTAKYSIKVIEQKKEVSNEKADGKISNEKQKKEVLNEKVDEEISNEEQKIATSNEKIEKTNIDENKDEYKIDKDKIAKQKRTVGLILLSIFVVSLSAYWIYKMKNKIKYPL